MENYHLFDSIDLEFIENCIANNEVETLTLEFKTVSGTDLKDKNDRSNFATALSGFANSSGGIIIWGVVADKNSDGIDCAMDKKEIEPLSLFLSKLEDFTGQFVIPTVEGVRHKKILSSESEDKGFAVT